VVNPDDPTPGPGPAPEPEPDPDPALKAVMGAEDYPLTYSTATIKATLSREEGLTDEDKSD